MKIGIQGVRGAFHEEAAMKWFGEEITPLPCRDFPDLLDALVAGQCDRAVMAVENTISGTMQRNLRLLSERDLFIAGEVRMPIIQNLGVLPGVALADIAEVRSHYMALNQCRRYFLPHPGIRLVDDEDTAIVARQIRENGWTNVGCIASARAIELYELECIGANIADDKANLTRFLVLERGRQRSRPASADLATLTLVLPHRTGSLNSALTCLFEEGISLSKVESMPFVGRPYEYEFVMDLEADDADQLEAGIRSLGAHADRLNLLGMYQRDRSNLS